MVILDALVKSSFIQRSPPSPTQLSYLPILKCLHCYRRARRLILWSWCFSHPNEEASPLFTTYVSKYGLLAVTVANESADPLLPTDFYCLVKYSGLIGQLTSIYLLQSTILYIFCLPLCIQPHILGSATATT